MFVLSTKPMYVHNPGIEWVLTAVFTVEYFLRVFASTNPLAYVVSFYGIVDFLSIFPAYFELLNFSTGKLTFLRAARTMRAVKFLEHLERSVPTDDTAITVPCFGKVSVFTLQIIRGICTLLIIWFVGAGFFIFFEPETVNNYFESYYFMVVSATTVGYGEISPSTWKGQLVMMFLIMIFFVSVPYLASNVSASYETYEERATEKNMKQRSEFVRQESIKEFPKMNLEREIELAVHNGFVEENSREV